MKFRTQSMDSLVDMLHREGGQVEMGMPGPFVDYDEEKDRSCDVSLASTGGYIKKVKNRKLERTLYEFLSLAVWNDLLREYTKANPLRFKAPKPVCLTEVSEDRSGLIMTYISGHKLKSIGNMKKNTPIKIKRQRTPLPLYPACALHLGALNRIKEEEGLVHSDYDDRHVIFSARGSPTQIGVIDVENSVLDQGDKGVYTESKNISEEFFRKKAYSEEEVEALGAWYNQGAEDLILPRGKTQIADVIWQVGRKYAIDFDMFNKTINGHYIPMNKKD